MTREIDAEVVIVGCGIAGAVLAAILVRAGVSVIVLEKQRQVPERYRGEIIQPFGVEVLRRHGFLDTLFAAGAARVGQFEDVCIFEGEAVVQHRSVRPSPKLGGEAVILHHRLLMEAIRLPVRELLGENLLEGFRVSRVDRIADGRCAVTAVDADGAALVLRANLLVGADGAQSAVRRALPFVVEEPLPRWCFAGLVLRTTPGAFPHFTSMYPLGRGVIGNAFPVRHDELRLCMCISHEASRAAHDGLEQDLFAFGRATLAPLGYAVPDEIVETLRIEPVFHVRTERAILDGACLVGDAAGTVHPITGYGMTMAWNDVLHLGRLLLEHRPTSVVPAAVLESFEHERRRIRARLEELSDLMVRTFLGTEEPDLVDAQWRWFTGKDEVAGHEAIARMETLGEELGNEFGVVAEV